VPALQPEALLAGQAAHTPVPEVQGQQGLTALQDHRLPEEIVVRRRLTAPPISLQCVNGKDLWLLKLSPNMPKLQANPGEAILKHIPQPQVHKGLSVLKKSAKFTQGFETACVSKGRKVDLSACE